VRGQEEEKERGGEGEIRASRPILYIYACIMVHLYPKGGKSVDPINNNRLNRSHHIVSVE